MRAVVQRVRGAKVSVDAQVVGQIHGDGLLVYLAAGEDDTDKDVSAMVDKVSGLRIFPDERRAMNRSVLDVGGQALVISQFTLYGDCRRGKRPSFVSAMDPEPASQRINMFIEGLKKRGMVVAQGQFGALMAVESTNWGPVTILIDSKKAF